MFKKIMCLVAFVWTLGMFSCMGVNANALVQVNLKMGSNYEKSDILEIDEPTELHASIDNAKESQSYLRYDLDSLEELPIPGKDPILIPQTVKSDFLAPGKEEKFVISVKPGKYRITLHSDEGNCEGSGAIAYSTP